MTTYRIEIIAEGGVDIRKISHLVKDVDQGIWRGNTWRYEVNDMNGSIFFFRDHLTNFVEKIYPRVNDELMANYQIQLWILYGYKEQCNLEFDAKDLELLTANNISLCISCWESS